MPDREFIHSTADVTSMLQYAFDSGFQVLSDEPQTEARPLLITQADGCDIRRGQFFLFRPEWVYGPWQVLPISGGYNVGKYFVSPRVNFSPITAYFSGERTEHGPRKFGSCVVSCHADWLEQPAKVVHPSPPEVRVWYKRFVKHLSSGIAIKAGVHKYHVCNGVLQDPEYRECLPPFDYIPWDFWKDRSVSIE